MNKFIFLSLLLLTFSCRPTVPTCNSCDFNCITDFDNSVISSQNCIPDHECTFELFQDMKVDHDEENGMKASQNSFIIAFSIYTEGAANIADDEFQTLFMLEIPNSNESFDVDTESLQSIAPSLRRSCFCQFTDWKYMDSGCIQGEKIDGTWHVQGDIEIDYFSNESPINYKFDFKVD